MMINIKNIELKTWYIGNIQEKLPDVNEYPFQNFIYHSAYYDPVLFYNHESLFEFIRLYIEQNSEFQYSITDSKTFIPIQEKMISEDILFLCNEKNHKIYYYKGEGEFICYLVNHKEQSCTLIDIRYSEYQCVSGNCSALKNQDINHLVESIYRRYKEGYDDKKLKQFRSLFLKESSSKTIETT